ncbi:hypothetical protein Efla_007196 [Eimeria flavescens]
MDRLNGILRKLESEDLSPRNSRGSFFARERSALAIPSPSNLTRSFFRCDRRGHWRGGDYYSRRGADEGFAATVAAIVSRARSFNRDLHDGGLHLNEYVEGLRFRVSVAESTSSRMRTLLQDTWRELVSAREGVQEAERVKADSGKSEGAIATLTSERDDLKSEKGKLRDEAERLRKENEHLRQQSKPFEQESVAKIRHMERLKQEIKERGVRPSVLNSETLAVIDTFRDEVTEWESRALESSDRKRKAFSVLHPPSRHEQ